MRQYKANLSVVSSRYSDLERRVIEFFVDNPQQDTIFLPGGLQLLLGYLVKDGLLEIKAKLLPSIGGSIFTNDEYHLTDAGQEFVDHLRGNEPLADVIAWAEDYWPNGRHIYYEGGEPEAFAATIKDEFGLEAMPLSHMCPWGRRAGREMPGLVRLGEWLGSGSGLFA